MDLNSLFANESAVIELKHPYTGEVLMDESKPPKPMTFTVIGTHTNKYKSMERQVGFDAIKRNKHNNVDKMNFEEFEGAVLKNDEKALELKSKTVIDCNIFMDGKQVKFSQKAILDLLSDERTSWTLTQLTEELDKNELFIKS